MIRIKRRQIVLAVLVVIVLYLAISIFAEQGTRLGPGPVWTPKLAIPNRFVHFQNDQKPLVKPSFSSSDAVPGFEGAPPSCRITDMLDDPLVQEYGQNNIRLSRTYEGSGYRVRKMLRKALRGEPIKVAVVGGSVSTGHSLTWPYTADNHMHHRVFKWFEDTFPDTEHIFNMDSAIPAVTARFFSYCIHETLPEDADLVLIEMDINHEDPTWESLKSTEAMYRTILSLPHEPAVIYMSIFGLVFQDLTHGWHHSALISQWLDVPEINLRNWYLPHLMLHSEAVSPLFTNWANEIDPRHINTNGHRATGDMVIAYLREQLCVVQRGDEVDQPPVNPIWPTIEISKSLPRLGLLDKWDEKTVIPILHPKCQSITSTKFPLQPLRAQGWESVVRNDKKSFEATEIGAEISFNVSVDAGLLGMFYWMTKLEGFGSVACWVDDDKREERIRRLWGHNKWHQASTFENSGNMWDDLTPGQHILTCKVEAGDETGSIFRIAATVSR